MSTATRERTLAAIRAALAGATPEPLPASLPIRAAPKSLLEQFIREATAVGAEVASVSDDAAARAQIHRWLEALGARRVVCAPTPLVARLRLSEISNLKFEIRMLDSMASAGRREVLLAADAGIGDADYALADTGTLVLRATPAQGRLVSLAPPAHLALLSRERILPDLAAAFAALDPPALTRETSLLTLVTGPSRTADIEQTLTVGVHGPGKLFVLLIG